MRTKSIHFSIALLLSAFAFAQQGINYKALLKDDAGNVLNNRDVDVQFTVEISGLPEYQEVHSVQTDDNGIIILNIGEGTTTIGNFNQINWGFGLVYLNVQIDSGDGYTDLGTTLFNEVPYAIHASRATSADTADNVSGLQLINEGGNTGWRLIGQNPNNYGNIGLQATDLSYSNLSSTTYGATGPYSVTMGIRTSANGDSSLALGSDSTASEDFSVAIGAGATASEQQAVSIGGSTQASGFAATALGFFTEASGTYAAALGERTRAQAQNATAIGRYNIGNGLSNSWNEFDPLFEIGNGTSNTSRSNALTVRKNGSQILNSTGYGMRITTGSDLSDYGLLISNSGGEAIIINSAGADGIIITGASEDGIFISGAEDDGIVAYAEDSGARVFGDNVGLYASGGASQSDIPDIILGSSNFQGFSADGIISTNPERSSSDMFLRSYDAVVVELDYDNNEGGNFRVRNGAGTNVFDVSESGNVQVNGSVVHSSDRRLKNSIEDISYGLEEILQLQPKQYYWNSQPKHQKSLGLIAQEVQSVIKEIVVVKDDEAMTLGVSYTELVPILIKAIQEQQSQINTLKSTLQNKEKTNQEQEQLLKSLLDRVEALEQSNN